jgi:hypothetical protein
MLHIDGPHTHQKSVFGLNRDPCNLYKCGQFYRVIIKFLAHF